MKDKLQDAVNIRFLRTVRETLGPKIGNKKLDKALREWDSLCAALGIERTHEPRRDKVVVTDPSPGGTYLQMDQDRATLILTIGLP
jgi:hypothetical protein